MRASSAGEGGRYDEATGFIAVSLFPFVLILFPSVLILFPWIKVQGSSLPCMLVHANMQCVYE